MRKPPARYRTAFADSARWDSVALRPGDIIISTPQKCGTTWMQTICALLVFQSPELPAMLDELSIWPDFLVRDEDDMAEALEAQQNRRFMKTHSALDGLPYDDSVTYITVGRDPRDAGVSYINHQANLNVAAMQDRGATAFPTLPALPRERFWRWANNPPEATGLASLMHHLSTAWEIHDRPNVLVVHYQQLLDDLPGTMRLVADRLGIEVPAARWPGLVKAATFSEMRTHIDNLVPERDMWLDRTRFFRSGTSGQWRALLDEPDQRRYRDRVRALAVSDLVAWAHQGQPL
jgi:hypothetical protein